jgi:SOS response regulatory protein OraA/RecX
MDSLTSSLIRHATRLLVNRPHSAGELRQKLFRVAARRAPAPARGGFCDQAGGPDAPPPLRVTPAAATDLAIADLSERGLLDDDAYASWHVEQRAAGSRARSRAQLAAELCAKNLSGDVAAAAMSGYSDQRAAEAIVDRKSATLSPASLRRHLKWKGFRHDTINSLVPPARRG